MASLPAPSSLPTNPEDFDGRQQAVKESSSSLNPMDMMYYGLSLLLSTQEVDFCYLGYRGELSIENESTVWPVEIKSMTVNEESMLAASFVVLYETVNAGKYFDLQPLRLTMTSTYNQSDRPDSPPHRTTTFLPVSPTRRPEAPSNGYDTYLEKPGREKL